MRAFLCVLSSILIENFVSEMNCLKNEHKLFLQNIMCRKILNVAEVKQLFKSCYEASGAAVPHNPGAIAELVNAVNSAISPFNMKISKGIGEIDGKQYYALLNTKESAVSLLASHYTKVEMDFFLKLVDQIIESEVGEVSSVNALNLTDKLQRPMSKMDAQELLSRLQSEHWITQTRGKISLDTLAILELDPYIKEEFEGVQVCKMCMQIVLRGPSCNSCEIKMHNHCATRVFKDSRHPICPSCTRDWLNEASVSVSGSSTSEPSQKRSRKH